MRLWGCSLSRRGFPSPGKELKDATLLHCVTPLVVAGLLLADTLAIHILLKINNFCECPGPSNNPFSFGS